MDEEKLKAAAAQLRQPHGEAGRSVGEKMYQGNVHINRHTIEQLQVKGGDIILEIGMGNGFFVKDILSADKAVSYTGCDFSPLMVEEAAKLNKPFIDNGQARFLLASANQLPFADKSFNKIFTVNTLYFWDNPSVILAEMGRVLQQKGLLLIAIRPKRTMQKYPFVKYGFRMFSKEEVVDLLSENNFTVTAVVEKQEPDQEINGEFMEVETLIIAAIK